MLSLYIIYIARIMIIYSSSRYTKHYYLYLSNCLALLIINKESYCSILRFVINYSSHTLMWWIDSMKSFWSRLSISSWSHMSKSCKNVFFMFFAWNEICKLKLFNRCILTKLQSICLWKKSSSAKSWRSTMRFICTWCWLQIFWFYVLNKSQKSQEISIQRNLNNVKMLHEQKSWSCRVFIYTTAFSLTVTINLWRRLMTCQCQ